MPHVWMMSFDWDGFNKLIARPSSALVRRLVRLSGAGRIASNGSPSCPATKRNLRPTSRGSSRPKIGTSVSPPRRPTRSIGSSMTSSITRIH